METRRPRIKRARLSNHDDFVSEFDDTLESELADPDETDAIRKSRIRDSNKEFARRMTILTAWSEYWSDYQTREGDAYPTQEAKNIIKKCRKITCPIPSCHKPFTTIGGLRYHYARCNIERAIKCLVCKPPIQLATRGELLRHMILTHSQELPPLNQEQQEIVSSYFSCEHRIDKREKRDKRVNIENESQSNSQTIIKSYFDMVVKNFQPQAVQQRPFMTWYSPPKDWELIPHIMERRRFHPPESESAKIKRANNVESMNLKVGEFAELEFDKRNNPTSYLFFTGGINTAIAWQPKSIYDRDCYNSSEILAIAVNCCSMEQSYTYKESHNNGGCIQFWTLENASLKSGLNVNNSQQSIPVKIKLSYMVAHSNGTIFDMAWCPLGASWLPKELNKDAPYTREGLLALACGDGQIRILCVPDTKFLLSGSHDVPDYDIVTWTPMFRVKPIANLMPPGVGLSSDYQAMSCKSICWCTENGQKLIAAGYVNGSVALYDLSITSPILYVQLDHYRHVYRPLKSWFAHAAPVTSVAFSAFINDERYLIATGSIDRYVKIFNPFDLDAQLATDRAPVNKICWDFRFRGLVSATDQAFTSYNNKVSYKYPGAEAYHSVTISSHRSSVYGLANSLITSSIATSDQGGEVFVAPQLINKTYHKRDKNLLSVHSLFSMVPYVLGKQSVRLDSSISNDQAVNTVENVQIKGSNTIENNYLSQQPLLPKYQHLDSSNTNTSNTSLNAQGPLSRSQQQDEIITIDEDGFDADADFSHVERNISNMPDKFLLPMNHHPVTTYHQFKNELGIEFHSYDSTPTRNDSKIPESCIRAMDIRNVFCDRPCDYPFSSINEVTWSPNTNTFPYLLSATHIGLCRLDKVQIIEQIFKSHIEQLKPKIADLQLT